MFLRPLQACLAALFLPLILNAQEPGAIRATSVMHPDGTRTETKTDPDAKTSEVSTYSGTTLKQRVVYKLDERNEPVSGTVYNAKGTPVCKLTLKRDGAGRVAEESYFSLDDKLQRRHVYGYAADGRLQKIQAFDAAGNEIRSGAAKKDQKKSLPRRNR